MLGNLKLLRLLDGIEHDPIFIFILGSYFEDLPKLSTSKFPGRSSSMYTSEKRLELTKLGFGKRLLVAL